MAEDTPKPPEDEEVPTPEEPTAEEPAAEEPVAPEEPAAEEPAPAAEEEPAPAAEEEPAPAAEEEQPAPAAEEEPAPAADAEPAPAAEEQPAPAAEAPDGEPREKPVIPGADLELDLVLDSEDRPRDPYAEYDEDMAPDDALGEPDDVVADEPVVATIDLAAGARYTATGKRKTSVARVILKPGTGAYSINGKELDRYFPRSTLQRQIRQPLESVGYEERMDVVARLHGGGVSAQAGALRHGISRALLEADPNLRGELKRRGFLTRDPRVKERKKAGLKKARKRPQFSKR
jgi:small subunit ribosomal protein S9